MTDEDKGGRVSAVLDESLYFLLLALPWRGGRESEKTFWERWGSEVGKERGEEGGCNGAMIDVQVRGMCTDGSRAFQEYLINPARANGTLRGEGRFRGQRRKRGMPARDFHPTETGGMCPSFRVVSQLQHIWTTNIPFSPVTDNKVGARFETVPVRPSLTSFEALRVNLPRVLSILQSN